MVDLCKYWDAMNIMIIMLHNEIKASFEHNIHIVGHTFNVQLYKRLRRFVSRYATLVFPLLELNLKKILSCIISYA